MDVSSSNGQTNGQPLRYLPFLAGSEPGLHDAAGRAGATGIETPTWSLLECQLMVAIPESARSLLLSGRLAHLVTINPDGSPQVSIVWVGLDGDEIVLAHLGAGQKMRNVERDPRVALSVEGTEIEPPGLQQYLLVYGTARITEGGGPQLLQELAHVYLGPDVKFPAFDNPPPGRIMHISVERVAGVGPWATTD